MSTICHICLNKGEKSYLHVGYFCENIIKLDSEKILILFRYIQKNFLI